MTKLKTIAVVCLVDQRGRLRLDAGGGSGRPSATDNARPRCSGLPPRKSKAQPPLKLMSEYVVEPPDLLVVEVLEALPGRPISGERLVRPDGKISLGFYGDLYVAGLTTVGGQGEDHPPSAAVPDGRNTGPDRGR